MDFLQESHRNGPAHGELVHFKDSKQRKPAIVNYFTIRKGNGISTLNDSCTKVTEVLDRRTEHEHLQWTPKMQRSVILKKLHLID